MQKLSLDKTGVYILHDRKGWEGKKMKIYKHNLFKNKKKMINNVYFYTVANICKGEQKDLRKGGGNIIFDVKYKPLN